MKLTQDLHTHTIHSHGTGTVEENVQAALQAGLEAIAITDHGPGHLSYGIRKPEDYLADILAVRKAYGEKIQVKTGIELNLIGLDGSTDLPAELAAAFDVKIMGYHKFTRMANLQSFHHFYIKNRVSRSKSFINKTTDAYISAMEKYHLSIVAHPTYGIPVDVRQLARACRHYGVLFELNSSHQELSPQMIADAAQEGPSFVLSSDAHTPLRVGDCAFAMDKAMQAGLTSREIYNAID